MNLIPLNFQTSPVISKLFRFESVIYRGEIKQKVQRFETMREGETFNLITTTLIRKEESLVWKSCLDMLEFSMKTAAKLMSAEEYVLHLEAGWDKTEKLIKGQYN